MNASFLSSIFGTEASASYGASTQILNPNSQTLALLEANVALPSRESTKSKSKDKEEINEDVNVNIVSETALLPMTGPSGVSEGGEEELPSLDEVSFYVIRKGDTFSQIAEMFGITVDTILSANDLPKGSKPKEGEVLLILPFSGVEHKVLAKQTLKGIANLYGVGVNQIISANDLEDDKIAVGETLMIPGANMLSESKPKPKGGTITKGSSSLVNVSGYFINPVPGAKRTRGIIAGKKKHNGVDLAASTGTRILAAAGGKVLIARNGYNGGFGNYVVIQHPNGLKTLYAHMSRLGTTPGASVAQGEVIGYVGNTGHSFGAHLHIEVLGGKNPF